MSRPRPVVMGILNVTPDSFYDGGRHTDPVGAAQQMLDEGADWIDVGGASTRSGAAPVDPVEEMARVIPVIRALSGRTTLSVDTTSPEVAAAALLAGAGVLNDISGLEDPAMAALSADAAGVVVMHMRGTPATMQRLCDYDDVVEEVRASLLASAARARCPSVWIDPGIGFAKTAAQSLRLLARLDRLVDTGLPVLVGASRKSFIGATLGLSQPGDRLYGSLGAAAHAWMRGAAVLRVHDVRATREMLDLLWSIEATEGQP